MGVRFLGAREQQSKKRAIFHFFQKTEKTDFRKLQKLIDLSNAERSGAPIWAINI